MAKIYVASSWRNEQQPEVVQVLRAAGHEVYDFRGHEAKGGFHWSQIDPNWQHWSPVEFVCGLTHPLAVAGFDCDMAALDWCDICVVVMPCGRGAHLEGGYAIGSGKPSAILLADGEPELMYRMFELASPDLNVIVRWATRRIRKPHDKVWLGPGAGMTGEAARLQVEILPEEFDGRDPLPCMLDCGRPGCREWSTVWTVPDPEANGKRHVLCHISECEMFDEPQGEKEHGR